MKNNIILYICSLAVLFGVVSCDKLPLSDVPIQHIFYFKFKQKTGEQNDYFTTTNTYIPDSVKIKYENEPYQKFYYNLKNDYYIFRIGDYKNTHTYYIDYRNGDIDTLTNTYVSSKTNPNVKEMQRFTWYFNGQMIKDFDFENNSVLKKELDEKNCDECPINDAIIIDILK